MFFFFFQAEDGIRDIGVTGVQTCALPILAVTLRKPIRKFMMIFIQDSFVMKYMGNSYMAFVIFGLIATFLKLENFITAPWWVVLSPIWVPMTAAAILICVYLIILLLKEPWEK